LRIASARAAAMASILLAGPGCEPGSADGANQARQPKARQVPVTRKAPQAPGVGKLRGAEDGDSVTLAGRVVSAWPGFFVLDVGEDRLKVEVDDGSSLYKEGSMLRPGDEVVVAGRVDRNLYVKPQIEARRVYVPRLDLNIYASPADEENDRAGAPVAATIVDLVGRVEKADGEGLLLRAGTQIISVSLSRLPAGSSDAREGSRIEAGDKIYVWGHPRRSPAGAQLIARGLVEVSG
jgi:uncharacterized protein YdeI (BOF family)